MNIGEKLLELRKKKGLSQEEAAFKLNVTRQTISKWETNQSTPDFDRIIPICTLYEISAQELLTKRETKDNKTFIKDDNAMIKKKAKKISCAVFLYFIAVVWIMITIPVFKMNPIVSTGLFIIICGVATFLIVYSCMAYKDKKKTKESYNESPVKIINNIISLVTLIIYLVISFITMSWHITWIIWIIYALVAEIVKLIFILKGGLDEK